MCRCKSIYSSFQIVSDACRQDITAWISSALVRQLGLYAGRRLVARVAVELHALLVVTNAAVVVLRRALVVEGVGISARISKGAAVEVARREECSRRGGQVIMALGVAARTSVVVILKTGPVRNMFTCTSG